MRTFYDSGALTKQYMPEKVYVQATDTDRSYHSAMANLVGTFGLHNDVTVDESWEDVKDLITNMGDKHPFKINQVRTEDDMLVHLKETNCLRWAQLRDSASENPDIVSMEADVLKFFGQMYYGKLSQITGIPLAIDDHKKAREICSTIYWMK